MHLFKNRIAALTLIPSGGGVFEVSVNDALVHSKDATGRFPEGDAIAQVVDRATSA